MRVSAVVLSFNAEPYLEDCVRSLVASFARSSEPSEIWVVENGSADGSPALLRALEGEFPGVVKGIFHPVNTGTTRSRNEAMRRASGRYILVMDSDARMSGPTLERLVEIVDGEPDVGIAVPRLTYPDGRFQLSTDRFPTLGRKLQRFFGLRWIEERSGVDPDSGVQDVDYAISAVWLMPRTVLERVGYLDERIFYSPEDVDYCLRVWKAGLRVVMVPDVPAVHDAQEISRGFKMSRFTLRHALGLAYLFAKHRYCLGLRFLYRRLGRDAG